MPTMQYSLCLNKGADYKQAGLWVAASSIVIRKLEGLVRNTRGSCALINGCRLAAIMGIIFRGSIKNISCFALAMVYLELLKK